MSHGYLFVIGTLRTSNCCFGAKTCEDDFEDKVQHEYGGSQEQDEKAVLLHNSGTKVDESVSEDEIKISGSETYSSDSGTDGDVEEEEDDDETVIRLTSWVFMKCGGWKNFALQVGFMQFLHRKICII
jgi:hypothetical protein